MIVLYNTNYTHNSNAYLTSSILEGAIAVFGVGAVMLAENDNIMQLAAKGVIRTLICFDGQRLRYDILQRVRLSCETMVLWLFEDPFMLNQNVSSRHLFDFIFTNDPACVAAYGEKAQYLPLAASPTQDFRALREDAELDYDIFFAGTMWPNRITVVERLIGRFPDARLKLVCPTNEYLPPLSRVIAERCIDRPVSHSTFADFANRSKTVLTIYRDYTSGDGISAATAPGPRYFELALAGTPQVVAIGTHEAAEAFDTIPGNTVSGHMVEVFDALELLINSPSERHRRAALSQQAVLGEHLYEHRLRRIKASIDNRQVTPSPLVRRTRTRVVFCTHSVKTAGHIGGIEIYQDLLGSLLGQDFEVFYWIRGNETCTFLNKDLEVIETFSSPEIGWLDVLADPHEEALFSGVLTSYDADIVHFHHLGHHSASLPIIAKALGIGVVFSVHDYYLVCSRYNLLDFSQRFCDIASRPIVACDACLKLTEGIPYGAQQTRRAFMSEVIDSCDVLIFGTQYSKDFLLKVYPRLLPGRCQVLGILNDATQIKKETVSSSPISRSLNIAVLGNVLRSKGADCLLRIIDLLKDSEDFVFYVFGKADSTYRDVLGSIGGTSLKFLNGYDNADIGSLPKCDVALFLSIWPETFSISLSEAWQAGMIPIATKMGAFSDRIEHGVNGFLVDVNDEAEVTALLQRLKQNPGIFHEMYGAISASLWPDRASHIGQLRALYQDHRPKARFSTKPAKIDIGQIGYLPHFSWKNNAPPRHILEAEKGPKYSLSLDLSQYALVEGATSYFLDFIGDGERIDVLSKKLIEPRPVAFGGWAYANNEVLAGKLTVCLIGERQTIFIDAERQSRHDVRDARAGAPEFSGFLARATMPGRWSDGFYYLVFLNRIVDRAYTILTKLGVKLDGGALVSMSFLPDDEAHRAFVRAGLIGALRSFPNLQSPLALVKVTNEPSFQLEEVTRVRSQPLKLLIRGWFYQHGFNPDAFAFISIKSDHVEKTIVVSRGERADVEKALNIGGVATGIREEVDLDCKLDSFKLYFGWSDGVSSSFVAYDVRDEGKDDYRLTPSETKSL